MNRNGSKSHHDILRKGLRASFLLIFSTIHLAQAYPPAPPHTLYGTVRGEQGEMLTGDHVKMVFKTDTGVVVSGTVSREPVDGVNYYLTIPMDAALLPGPYVPNAVTPLVPFRISVVIGTETNLPLEMVANYAVLGQVGASTRMDLTLGADADGDGMPDQWEEVLLSMLDDPTLTLNDITADGDADGDGMSNYDEYIAGTYAFDETDVFKLYISAVTTNTMAFSFLAIADRSYEIQSSSNLNSWVSVPFAIPANGADEYTSYFADSVGTIQGEIVRSNAFHYYRGIVK